MRVISGSARGAKLETIEGLDTRPTTDRVKESIFNMINYRIYDSVVLDLFTGSGSLGIETASRGAKSVHLVDSSKKCETVVKRNIEKTRLGDVITFHLETVDKFLLKIKGKETFDLIFMDPPYLKDFIIPILERIEEFELLDDEGIIVVEHDYEDKLPEEVGHLVKEKEKKYGRTGVTIYGKK